MKKRLLAFGMALVLTGCAAPVASELRVEEQQQMGRAAEVVHAYSEEDDDWGEPVSLIFEPDWILSPEETVETYLEQQYLSYVNMSYIDVSHLMDLDRGNNKNTLIWLQMLAQRRRLLYENDICYVETEMFPYEVTFIDASRIEDTRMDVWNRHNLIKDDEIVLHFVVTGEADKVYPPMLALNSQQTIRMHQVNGVWKITAHYFPGTVRKYGRTPAQPSREEMLESLWQEFAEYEVEELAVPGEAVAYDGEAAAAYAVKHMTSSNRTFYRIVDWMGNCANFTSQCIWYGFTGEEGASAIYSRLNMTGEWYAGDGGGSPAWENVNHFWNYAIGPQGFYGRELEGVWAVQNGDIIQTSSGTAKGDYNHSLIVVDSETLLLAQNSPACYVYYADLVNVDVRFLRPEYIV